MPTETAIQRLGLYRETGGDGVARLFGPAFGGDLAAAAAEMRGSARADRTGVRRVGDGFLVRAPMAGGAALWLVAAGRTLDAGFVAMLAAEAEGIFAAGPEGESAAGRILGALAGLPAGRGLAAMRRALATLADETGWTGLAALTVAGGRVGRIEELDRAEGDRAGSIRVFAGEVLAGEGCTMVANRAMAAARPEPDVSLYLEARAIPGFVIALPEGDGLGLYAEGTPAPAEVEAARAALALALGKTARPRRRRWPLVLAAVVAAAIFLAWPVRFEIGAFAEIEPARSEMVVIDYEARLVALSARVGEAVEEGQPLARFDSPELEEEEKEAALDRMLEALAAQEALASDDYASYQLAEQRKAIAEFRAEQSRRRLAALALTAPATGRIAFIVPEKTVGTRLPAGAPVAEIQIGAEVRARLRLAPGDGPLVEPGMTGEVVVRGLVDRSFPVTVIERPAPGTDAAGAPVLTVLAEVAAPGDAGLIKGLTGHARIAAGTRPRIAVWTRPVIDFLRLTAWTYLGLRL